MGDIINNCRRLDPNERPTALEVCSVIESSAPRRSESGNSGMHEGWSPASAPYMRDLGYCKDILQNIQTVCEMPLSTESSVYDAARRPQEAKCMCCVCRIHASKPL